MHTEDAIACFVVNLKKDWKRRENIEKDLRSRNIDFSIIEAVYGKELGEEAIYRHYDEKKAVSSYNNLSLNEIATALSHQSIYKKMIAESIDYALILEDDARLSEDVKPVLAGLQTTISPNEPWVVLLTHVGHYARRKSISLTDKHSLVVPVSRHVWLAHGYFVTQAAARRMLEALYPVWLPADHWRWFERAGIVNVRAVAPYCIGLSDFSKASNLEVDRKSKPHRSSSLAGFWRKSVCEQLKKLAWPFLKVSRQKKTW